MLFPPQKAKTSQNEGCENLSKAIAPLPGRFVQKFFFWEFVGCMFISSSRVKSELPPAFTKPSVPVVGVQWSEAPVGGVIGDEKRLPSYIGIVSEAIT